MSRGSRGSKIPKFVCMSRMSRLSCEMGDMQFLDFIWWSIRMSPMSHGSNISPLSLILSVNTIFLLRYLSQKDDHSRMEKIFTISQRRINIYIFFFLIIFSSKHILRLLSIPSLSSDIYLQIITKFLCRTWCIIVFIAALFSDQYLQYPPSLSIWPTTSAIRFLLKNFQHNFDNRVF